MFIDSDKRITAFVGHYGSGKTEVAVNYALALTKIHKNVAIADMDVVNPYFRTKDAKGQLESAGVKLVAPLYANTNVDLPVLPAELQGLFDDHTLRVVLDIGGDEDGAVALGSYFGRMNAAHCDLFCVINKRRLLTATPKQAVEYVKSIAAAARMPVTGLVNNTNLAGETTAEIILDSVEYAREVALITGVPLVATTVRAELAPELGDAVDELWPLTIKVEHPWLDDHI